MDMLEVESSVMSDGLCASFGIILYGYLGHLTHEQQIAADDFMCKHLCYKRKNKIALLIKASNQF